MVKRRLPGGDDAGAENKGQGYKPGKDVAEKPSRQPAGAKAGRVEHQCRCVREAQLFGVPGKG